MIGGASAVVKDVPPYSIAQGNHAKLFGLNLIGLKRRDFSEKTIKALKDAYRIIFRSNLLLEAALKKHRKKWKMSGSKAFYKIYQRIGKRHLPLIL